MAQYRQSGGLDRVAIRNGAAASDQVSVSIRGLHKQHAKGVLPYRRLKGRRVSIGALALILFIAFGVSAFVFFYLSSGEKDGYHRRDEESENDTDFLTNVTRTKGFKVVKFGHGSVVHGGDSRYWDRDDRRRDEDYGEDVLEHADDTAKNESDDDAHSSLTSMGKLKKNSIANSHEDLVHRGVGLYNEAGRGELKMYEAEYEASLKGTGHSKNEHGDTNQQLDNTYMRRHSEEVDPDDEYDDGIDLHDIHQKDYDEFGQNTEDHSDVTKSGGRDDKGSQFPMKKQDENIADIKWQTSTDSPEKSSSRHFEKHNVNSGAFDGQSEKKLTAERQPVSKKKAKRRKFSGSCEMKISNSTAQLIEPVEGRKFARFSLQYTEVEEKLDEEEDWEYRFAGHQSLKQREESFIAHDQRINCGFVRSPKGAPSTGFDVAEDDAKYISSCHIAVVSCIFGNSDRLRTPTGKMVSRISRKNVCFVIFVDETTLQTISTEGHFLDRMGFIGLWKVVLVKNLPYSDMRRVGKIPKFLSHRLFPSARYSIWLDSKLRLQLDPMLILEYFLWRKKYEYAISNHYDRHCVWEEVAQNKRLNKYNHTVIDQQFEFYQADGLKRFDALDPNKLLPSNVPEGSVIIRAHTPMSNLFSCLWFNEVDRFTPRDQLSFAYTYQKLRTMNPDKPFYLNMFKDCERRRITKLFRHRSEERRIIPQVMK